MEMPISQDIRRYKTKDIGNFSFKEAAFIAAGAGAAFLTYNLSNKSVEIAIIPMAIILVFGFLKPFGMTMVQFIRTVVLDKITPQCYINETDFEYDPEEIATLYGEEYQVSTEQWSIQEHMPVNNKLSKADAALIIK